MTIALCDYTSDWVTRFESEKASLSSTIGTHHRIVHIGSTAVQGLCAKPVIDILVGVSCLSQGDFLIPLIKQLGYVYRPDYEIHFPERRYFEKVVDNQHQAHIHLVETYSLFWKRHLFFRNMLRFFPDIRDRYAQLKQQLAAQDWDDLNHYVAAKSAFIRDIEDKQSTFQWETERLIIKPPTWDDMDALQDLWADPDVMCYVGDGKPRTIQQTQSGLFAMIDHYIEHGFTLGCVFHKETQSFIGRAGLIYLDYCPSNLDIEVGYMFRKQDWNNGYATECASFFIEWGFQCLRVPRIVGVSYPQNKGSQQVMTRCGMTPAGHYQYGDISANMFEIQSPYL